VVYNHTAEGSELGPTLSFRGIDNAAYYRLMPEDPRRYMDFTGTGNTLNLQHPRVLQLIMDSLRYWVQDMHVDGFRFDLASALARELFDVDRLGSFFDTISQDPVLSQVKLIAEPWDVGAGGYQVGNFPPGWNEWNDKYRDSVRGYWKGDGGLIGEFAKRFTGSADLYEASGRKPHASINFVTAHDGFTLADLVSYNHKHNEDNGEDNRDGSDDNRSWNCGLEGPTADRQITQLRERQKRNLIATLLLSQGVPMLVAGDELGRSQGGNNNAYCQDNEISWIDWELDPGQREFLAFVERVIALRRSHAIFSRRYFLTGKPVAGEDFKDITWFTPAGTEMTESDWQQGYARCLSVHLSGAAVHRTDSHGQPVRDENFTLLFNAHHGTMAFVLPPLSPVRSWRVQLQTATGRPAPAEHLAGRATRMVPARSLVLLMEVNAPWAARKP
jgi:isoamylase